MKAPEMILGYAEYDGGKYPFVYENGLLNLLPCTEVEWNKQKSNLLKSLMELSNFKVTHEWICNTYIRGTTNQGKNILFISKGESSNNNGFIQFEIQVIYEYDALGSDGDLINGLIITSDEIDYFFHPSRVFNSEFTLDEKNNLQEITVKLGRDINSTIPCGSYCTGDISVSVEVSAYSTYSNRSENPLSAQSQICFEFNKAIDLDGALEIIYQQESFLKYICYRKNVNLKDINVFKRNEKGLRSKAGKIYIISEETHEINKKKTKQVLTIELLEHKIIPVFQAIADGKVYLEHLCNCIDDKNSYNVARIILIFAAFEREYNNIFSLKPIRSEQYLETKARVLNLLEEFEKTCTNKKSKKYVKGFRKIIDNSDNSLSERIKNAFNTCQEVVRIFLNSDYQVVDEDFTDNIAHRMNAMRNHIAHGNLDLTIEPIHLSDFKMLEILIYVMRMNSLNISITSMKKSICQLFGYNLQI